MTPFKTLFLEVSNRLKTQVPELRYIEQDLGQLEQEHPPVVYPCALIDLTDFTYSDNAQGEQIAEGIVQVRLGMEVWSATSHLTPNAYREQALSFYDLEWKIYKALHSWEPLKNGYLMRESVSTEPREDNLRVRVLRFNTIFEDGKANDTYRKVNIKDKFLLTTKIDVGTSS